MKKAVAILHVPFEDLGSFEGALEAAGYSVVRREAGVDSLQGCEEAETDLLIVMGGPIGVSDAADYPFITNELKLLESRLAAERPTLGVCLGCQLMARALGSKVYRAPRKELGWGPLTLTAEGRLSCLRRLEPERHPVLHWHGDTFDLPAGATRLASTDICINQAFSWGSSALGLQFHPEVRAGDLERWFIGHAMEINQTEGVSVAGLREETARNAPSLTARAQAMLREWLQGLPTTEGP